MADSRNRERMPSFTNDAEWDVFQDKLRELCVVSESFYRDRTGTVAVDLSFSPDELPSKLERMATMLDAMAEAFRIVSSIDTTFSEAH